MKKSSGVIKIVGMCILSIGLVGCAGLSSKNEGVVGKVSKAEEKAQNRVEEVNEAIVMNDKRRFHLIAGPDCPEIILRLSTTEPRTGCFTIGRRPGWFRQWVNCQRDDQQGCLFRVVFGANNIAGDKTMLASFKLQLCSDFSLGEDW